MFGRGGRRPVTKMFYLLGQSMSLVVFLDLVPDDDLLHRGPDDGGDRTAPRPSTT